MDQRLRLEIGRLVSDMSAGRWEDIVADGRIGRCAASDVVRVIVEYGRTLVDLPSAVWDFVDVFEIVESGNLRLDVPLWTKEEGRSDLMLFICSIPSEEKFNIYIHDVRVP